jgi:hypothetical protein
MRLVGPAGSPAAAAGLWVHQMLMLLPSQPSCCVSLLLHLLLLIGGWHLLPWLPGSRG